MEEQQLVRTIGDLTEEMHALERAHVGTPLGSDETPTVVHGTLMSSRDCQIRGVRGASARLW